MARSPHLEPVGSPGPWHGRGGRGLRLAVRPAEPHVAGSRSSEVGTRFCRRGNCAVAEHDGARDGCAAQERCRCRRLKPLPNVAWSSTKPAERQHSASGVNVPECRTPTGVNGGGLATPIGCQRTGRRRGLLAAAVRPFSDTRRPGLVAAKRPLALGVSRKVRWRADTFVRPAPRYAG